MRELVEAAAAALARGEAVARVVVMQSFGSVPRTAGAAMLVRQDGGFVGTVGGGRLEAQCLIDAREALARRRTVVNRHDLSGQDAAGLGMICGGAVTMLVDPLLPEPANQALCRALGEALAARRKVLLLTLLGSGDQVTARQVVELEGPEPAGLPASARAQGARARAPFLLEDPTGLLLVEPVMVPDTLYLVGAGHVALPTAHLASRVGFRVVVLDDRAEFANLVRFPEAAEVRVVADYARGLFPPLGTSDFVVIVTRGHLHDQEALLAALEARPGYLGMIGSRRKRDAIYRNLRELGWSPDELARIHCPVGLAIGADTPEEIAVSIVAELIAHRAGKPTP